MPLKTAFGRALHDLRVNHGWTAAELAGRLGISEERLAEWERGQEVPAPAMLAALATLFERRGPALDGQRASNGARGSDAHDTPRTGESPDG